MQRRERQVPGLGDRQRGLHGLQIAHLANQDHVGVLPQHVLEGGRERACVAAHLTLVHEAVLVAVHELDRVLHGDDVPGPLPVDLVDHGRQGGRLSGSRRTGDQHEAPGLVGQPGDNRRQAQLLERQDLERDLPDGHRDRSSLPEHVPTEPGQVLYGEREIQLILLFESLLLLLGQRGVGQGLRLPWPELRAVVAVFQLPVDAELGHFTR